MTDENTRENVDGYTGEAAAAEEAPQYGVGPFSIREVALMGTWVVAFVVSFFPIYGLFEDAPSVWTSGIDWVLTIGAPTIAVFLIVLRRLSPQGIRRVGSLGIDQFASVAFSVATVLWLSILWTSFVRLAERREFLASWVVWVEFFLMLAGVALTAFAPFIPPFAQDFRGRPEVPAHRNARPVRPVAPRPAPVRPAPAGEGEAAPSADDVAFGAVAASGVPYTPTAADGDTDVIADRPGSDVIADRRGSAAGAGTSDEFVTTVLPLDEGDDVVAADEIVPGEEPGAEGARGDEPAKARESFEPVTSPSSTVEPAAATAPQHQAFWALVPEERDIVDEIGIPVFRIGPAAWALVIEDRGEAFVVRHEDGRIGYLHDVSGVTRG